MNFKNKHYLNSLTRATSESIGLIGSWELNESSGNALDSHDSHDGINTDITYEQSTPDGGKPHLQAYSL